MTDLLTGPDLDGRANRTDRPHGPRAWGGSVRSAAGRLRALGVKAGVTARSWRWTVAAPGLAGAGLVSAALAVRFGVWAGLLAAGLFCLRADSRV